MFRLTLIKLGNAIRESAEWRGWTAAFANHAAKGRRTATDQLSWPLVNIYVSLLDPGLY